MPIKYAGIICRECKKVNRQFCQSNSFHPTFFCGTIAVLGAPKPTAKGKPSTTCACGAIAVLGAPEPTAKGRLGTACACGAIDKI